MTPDLKAHLDKTLQPLVDEGLITYIYTGTPQPPVCTTYDDLRECIQRALDRDGQHDWDETSRLTDIIAPAVWNLARVSPIPYITIEPM